MPRPSAQKVLVIGIAAGLGAVVLVRLGVALLLGGLRALIILGIAGLAWLVFGRKAPRRDGS